MNDEVFLTRKVELLRAEIEKTELARRTGKPFPGAFVTGSSYDPVANTQLWESLLKTHMTDLQRAEVRLSRIRKYSGTQSSTNES